jgi:hypothetical protein
MHRACVLLVSMVLLPLSFLQSQRMKKPANERPGDEPYTPTKVEWAALELQASSGVGYTQDTQIAETFTDKGDGKTVLCIIQYTPDTPAGVIKSHRDSAQYTFDKYAEGRRWQWLRLQFDEHIIQLDKW